MNKQLLYQRALVCALTFAFAFTGIGETVDFNGTTIEYANAEVSRPDGDIVFAFKNPAAAGTLKLPSYARAWILSVGGGGAGGSVSQNSAENGAGGGGGGGFVEAQEQLLTGGTYSITVGAGGAAGEQGSHGEDGLPSKILLNGSELTAYTADGGGGGGGADSSSGRDGACGGGGSMASSATCPGGNATGGGVGFGGGAGGDAKAGGGGGGAAAAGTGTSKEGTALYAGNGGAGKSSLITVAAGEETVYYAGGGGGGTLASTRVGSGGSGVGGSGGGGMSGTKIVCESGKPNSGGGGGGGSHAQKGGAGGNGIVVIRITEALSGDPVKPVAPTTSLSYTGENQIVVPESLAYMIEGVGCATNAATYHVKVTLKEGFKWTDGTDDLSEFDWTILPQEVDYPTAPSDLIYNKENQIAVAGDNAIFVFDETSVTNATNAGTYQYTVTFKDNANYKWKDAEAGQEHAAYTVYWSIEPKKVTVPPVITGLKYTGEYQDAIDTALVDEEVCEFIDDGHYSYNQRDAGSYQFALTLKNTDAVKNYIWDIGDGTTYDDQIRDWSIAKAENAITQLSITGWKAGSKPNSPIAKAKCGYAACAWAASEDAPEEEWQPWRSDNVPTMAGTWWLRARSDETDNWLGAEAKVSFVLWDDPTKLFSDYVEISLGYSGAETLVNFPICVKISETSLPGFDYDRAGTDGESLAFICGDEMLDYDIESWNKDGESVVWVKIPQLKAGTKLTMWWCLKEGQVASGSNAAGVWEDYVGVWHMNGTKDSTGNSPSGTLNTNAKRAMDGLFGDAYGSRTTGKKGPVLAAAKNEALDSLSVTNGFTVSMWVRPATNETQNGYLFARKNSNDSTGWGLQCAGGSTGTTAALGVYYDGNKLTTSSGSVSLPVDEWTRVDVTYKPDRIVLWINGVSNGKYWSRTGYTMTNPTDLNFGIGGLIGTKGDGIFNGDIDEVRISKTVPTGETTAKGDARLGVEVAAATDPAFVKKSLVYRDGLRVNDWATRPSVTPQNWERTDDLGFLTVDKGTTLDGSAVSNYFYYANEPDVHFVDQAGLTNAGVARAVFVLEDATGYEQLKEEIELLITARKPYSGLGGSEDGRVLLMNNDGGDATHPAIDYQGWWDRLDRDPTLQTKSSYWECLVSDDFEDTIYNIKAGTSWVLWTQNRETRLWHLENCRHGNTYDKGAVTQYGNQPRMESNQNYLPWSKTSRRITTHNTMAARAGEVGQVLMRNLVDACVYSPCYTNGVGTIYFDVVNGWTRDAPDAYKIVVEVATETEAGPLTDENCQKELSDGTIDPYGNVKNWEPYLQYPVRVSASEEMAKPTGVLTNALGVTTGGKMTEFYRVYVPVNKQVARFRIRRVSIVPPQSGIDNADENLILLDNIIVSYPAMGAEMKPTGVAYDSEDKTRLGAQLLGYELVTETPFPAAGATDCYGRASVEYRTNDGDRAADPKTFFMGAKMHYRWRYLNQSFSDWDAKDLDIANGFRTFEPLDIPEQVGDIEFWFDGSLQAPFYSYVDYSGSDKGLPETIYTEEIAAITNSYQTATKPEDRQAMPTGAAADEAHWFFRLRNGASAWEGMTVRMTGGTALDGSYPMELLDDDMWRALVPIKKDAEGVCAVQFVGMNRLETGATELSGDWVVFGAGTGTTNAVPANGTCVEDGAPVSFAIDHNANYYEFKFSTKFMTWSIARAEYQNFNHWHDAYAKADTFKASFPTNGVDDIAMTTLTTEMGDWKLFSGEDDRWNEPFYLANSDDPGFPKDTVFSTHATPNSWTANNFSFVSSRFASVKDHSKDTSQGSGIAAKLLGKGQGTLSFTKDNAPNGLDTVTVNARLGQSITFNSFNYSAKAMFADNYTFFAPATMSQRSPQDGSKDGEMTVGASVSVVGYYFPSTGCYEFRIERVYSDKPIQLALYKWNPDGDCKCLCSMDWSGRYLWDNVDGNGNVKNMYYSLFMSLENTPEGTKIICGRSDAAKPSATGGDLYNTYGKGDLQHIGLVYTDKDSPLTFGAYGVTAKDCPAEFVNLCHYKMPLFGGEDEITGLTKTPVGDGQYYDANDTANKLTYPTDTTNWVLDRDDLATYWVVMPGRCEFFTHGSFASWKGLRTPTNLKQNLELYLQPKNGGSWEKYGTRAISGYAFHDYEFPLHLTGKWNLQLRTGSANVDVAIKSVKQTQWQAPDVEDILYKSDEFVYTQGIVVTNVTAKQNEVVLQPSRGVASAPFSVRSPVLQGLGKVSVSYRDVCEGAEIWLQMATNNVENRLTGVDSYNQSVTSVDMGEQEPAGTWVTIAKYRYADLLKASSQSEYLGFHNQPDRPITGIFRVFIPPAVVTEAGRRATSATPNLNWGKITITGVTVSDEPGLSDTSWFGYNLRGIGDASDGEKRMYLTDMTQADEVGNGMDLALNNSLMGVDPGDVVRAKSFYPSIVSPTFKDSVGGGKSGVGSVSFKARLYSTTKEALNVGRIVIYGASNSVDGRWDVLQTNEVTSMVFSDFSWESKGPMYKAIKLEVTTPAVKKDGVKPDVARVIIDEVVVGERIQPSLSFRYVRPFRQNLMTATVIEDILSANEQPLAGESWGVQTQLSLQQLTDEIDPDSFRVTFRYYVGEKTWGYENWKDVGSAEVELQQVGEKGDLIFRSVGDRPESLVEPVTAGGTVVQYQVLVSYRDRSGTEYDPIKIESPADWAQPSWYTPVDLNQKHGYSESRPDLYSAYTILDTVSPGRAWINEINFNDGTALENGGTAPVENQFIEICVPSGVDMTGWFLRLTDVNEQQWVMAAFGDGERLPKMSTRSELNGFAFVLAESPETNVAGGIRDADGNRVESDGVWGVDGISGTAETGTLSFSRPFQFELVRPSGVVEHQFVLGGTNTYSKYSWGDMYDSTNFLAKMNADSPSPLRFLAGDDLARLDDKERLASAGVITGAVDSAAQVTASGRSSMEPGQEDTWTSKLIFTPGAPNEDQNGRLQTIPEEWFVAPNGTNTWVTLKVVGDHLRQACGDGTASVLKFVLPQGGTTNIVYTADPWYELASLTMEGVEVAAHKAQGGVPFTYEIAPTGRTCTVVAEEGLDARLSGKLDMKGPYAPSVVNWLGANWPGRDPDEMKPAYVKELGEDDEEKPMDLLDMYFLDIPPFADEANPMELAADRIWWFRFGITNPHYDAVDRTRTYMSVTGPVEVVFHNVQIKAKLYVSNDVTKVAYAPKRLQGLDNARSDNFSGRWGSETFQVKGNLLNFLEKNEGFLPFRAFTFGDDSFTKADDPEPFTSTIEILDPFSTESPGFGYGWSKWRDRAGFGFKLSITTNTFSGTVEHLRAKSTYE